METTEIRAALSWGAGRPTSQVGSFLLSTWVGKRSFRYESCALLELYLPPEFEICTQRPRIEQGCITRPCAYQPHYLLTNSSRLEVFYPAHYPTFTMITQANRP